MIKDDVSMPIILISIAPGVKILMRKTDTGMFPEFTLHMHHIFIYMCVHYMRFNFFFKLSTLKKIQWIINVIYICMYKT